MHPRTEWIQNAFGCAAWLVQGDNYVLPLLWRGTPVKVSCPASQVEPQSANPPALCCAPYGVTVKLHKVSAEEDLRLNGKYRNVPRKLSRI